MTRVKQEIRRLREILDDRQELARLQAVVHEDDEDEAWFFEGVGESANHCSCGGSFFDRCGNCESRGAFQGKRI